FFRDEGDPEQSLVFWQYNTSKRSVTIDLETRDDVAALEQLVRGSDVLIETCSAGAREELGLVGRRLAEIAPRLIHVSITPFRMTGPFGDWRGCDLVAQAMGGMAFVNGHADEAPLRGFGLQAYHSASAYAAIATMLALLRREGTGAGAHVDVSLQACVAATV